MRPARSGDRPDRVLQRAFGRSELSRVGEQIGESQARSLVTRVQPDRRFELLGAASVVLIEPIGAAQDRRASDESGLRATAAARYSSAARISPRLSAAMPAVAGSDRNAGSTSRGSAAAARRNASSASSCNPRRRRAKPPTYAAGGNTGSASAGRFEQCNLDERRLPAPIPISDVLLLESEQGLERALACRATRRARRVLHEHVRLDGIAGSRSRAIRNAAAASSNLPARS